MSQSLNMHLNNISAVSNANEPRPVKTVTNPTTAFKDMFTEKLTPVSFSKHAASRLNDRNISLTGEQLMRLADGIGKASQKGIKDSLVIMDNIALVVNVKSGTVITAMNEPKDNVFSNIDGAVIV